MRKYFPFRRSNRGVQPGMAGEGLAEKEGSEKRQWIFPRNNPEEEVIRDS